MIAKPRHFQGDLAKVFISLAVVALMIVAAAPETSRSAAAVPESGQITLGKLPISYTIDEEDGDFLVSYAFGDTSSSDVRAATDNLREAAGGWAAQGRSFRATLVFGHPISLDEFNAFVSDTGVVVYDSIGRGVGIDMQLPPVWATNATGAPLVGEPEPGGDPIDLAILQSSGQRLLGIVSTDVMLDNGSFAKIAQDSRVKAIDILRQAMIDLVQQKHPGISDHKIYTPQSEIYSDMEKTGLAHVKP